MANVLEGLIAKGRRTHQIREQREVAFGLADLSSHEELHHRIVKKGGIKTLIHLLITSQDAETQRFCALALANTSCAELHRVEIATQENLILHLTTYVKNIESDLLGRQYCAMAMGNLAVDPNNHADIVKLGAIEALMLLLNHGADEEDIESGRYAAFALSNLASNSKYHKAIVDAGAIETLITISCLDNLNSQREAMNVLRGLCFTYEFRAIVVNAGILDPLVLIARSEDLDVVREVAALLNCLSTVHENKVAVTERAISTIITMLLSGDQVVEHHACSTMANLTEIIEIHPRILDEDGLPPLVSMFSSTDLNCNGEAARALANLSSNSNAQKYLVSHEILDVIVQALVKSDVNCQRFAALCLANLATTVSSQIKIVKAGSISPLVHIVLSKDNQLEARRYACLALANLSATVANHQNLLQNEGLKALFCLSKSYDVMSQYYVGCTLANLSSNVENHNFIIEQGGIQPVISMAYSADVDVQKQASACLRGLSASNFIKMKIVQEGGLEPLSRLLLSSEIEVLREVTACFCNLSLVNENKVEIAKSGVIPSLITLMQFEDKEVSCYSSACLANLAEVSDNQELIALEGAIEPCLWVMRSRYIDVKREGGRLLANLCACKFNNVTDIAVENGGHKQLMSYLLSRDMVLQRVGAFGVGNLCTHTRHRKILCDMGVLEPLSTLVQSDGVDLEIQRFSMIAIINLAAEVQNHQTFIHDRILQLMISFSNAKDAEIRQYAAMVIVNLAKNTDIQKIITDEGGLDPVLYLARTDDKEVRCEILPAITALSFVDSNREQICKNGGLDPILQEICRYNEEDGNSSRLACCAMANLSEGINNLKCITEANTISLLNEAFSFGSSPVKTEAARALGNLVANLNYGELVIKNSNILQQFVSSLSTETFECRRMVSMALSNIASNTKMHPRLFETNIFDTLCEIFRTCLDSKCVSDLDTCQFCLLLIANLATRYENHLIIINHTLDYVVDFCRHRDIKCRQNAVIVLGNLCSNSQYMENLSKVGALDILISFSFPPLDMDNKNVQFQAIAGIRGLGTCNNFRKVLVDKGCCEPLILAARHIEGQVKTKDMMRESGAALYNLALCPDNGMKMVQSGLVRAVSTLLDTDDIECQVFAIGALANLAEHGRQTQSRLINDGCLAPLITHAETNKGNMETKREISRCLALFANNIECHSELMHVGALQCIFKLLHEDDTKCCRFAALSIGNLALFEGNHKVLMEADMFDSFNCLLQCADLETKRCVAFAYHNMCKNEEAHKSYETSEMSRTILSLLLTNDYFTQLHSCLALKFLTVSKKARVQFIEHGGLSTLLALSIQEDKEMRREVAAALRNLSISDNNKTVMMRENVVQALVSFGRSSDPKLCHQACGVLANLAEVPQNQELMMKEGILHHLKFFMICGSTAVKRECLRGIANLSYDFRCTDLIVIEGGLTPLIQFLSEDDEPCRRYAAMAISNLSTKAETQNLIVEDGGIQPLLYIASSSDTAKRNAFFALTNLSASKSHQITLVSCGVVSICCTFLKDCDRELTLSAALCLSNLASNQMNHSALIESNCLQFFMDALKDQRCMQLRAVSFLRGLSSNGEIRTILKRESIISKLLDLALAQDIEIQVEALATICNMSLDGCIDEYHHDVFKKVDMKNLISFLCSSDATCRLFGALSIGNIASETQLQHNIVEGGSLAPLINVGNSADVETQRCIAYALSNLCAEASNRLSIVSEGGLVPLFLLTHSNDSHDVFTAVSAIRGLASTTSLQRELVIKGGLEPLFSIIDKVHDKSCTLETLQTIASLSLNDENKSSIVKSESFPFLFKDKFTHDSEILSVIFRILGNCCECHGLHEIIIHRLFEANIISNGVNCTDVPLCREVSRFFSNLCANISFIDILVAHDVPQILINLMESSSDIIVFTHVILGFLNLSSKETYRLDPTYQNNLLDFLLDFISFNLLGKDEDIIKGCGYACLTLGNLLWKERFFHSISRKKVLDVLQKTLDMADLETRFYASFALHQLSKFIAPNAELKNTALEKDIIKFLTTVPTQLMSHVLCTVRYISSDYEISKIILHSGVLEVLIDLVDDATTELKRELCCIFCHLSAPTENKYYVVNSPVLLSLFNLSDSDDPEIGRFSMAALANVTEDPLTHKLLFLRENLFYFLVSKITSANISIKREASRAISNLLSSEISHQMFLNANGLDAINTTSGSHDKEYLYSVGLSLHKLSHNFLAHETILKVGTLHVILHLAKWTDCVMVSRQAMSALRKFSSNKDVKVLIAQKGGLQTAIDLLTSDDLSLQILAAGTLQHLSAASRLKCTLCSDELLHAMTKCVTNTKDEILLYHCAATISNISEHPKAKDRLWDLSFIDLILQMALYEIKKVQSRVARTFSFLSATIPSQSMSMKLKYITSIIRFLSSSHEYIASDAALAIGNIAVDASHQILICKLGALKPLIKLLQLSPSECSLNSCRAISRMSIPFENKSICARHTKLIEILIRFCSSQNQDLLRFTSMVLCNLSTNEMAQKEIISRNGIEALLSMTNHRCDDIVRASIKTICNLEIKKENRDRIVNQGGIKCLYLLLQHKNATCIELAEYALSNLCGERDYNRAIIESGLLNFLSDFTKDFPSSTKHVASAKLFYNLSMMQECHTTLSGSYIIDSMKFLCKSDNNECRYYSIMALANLSANELTRYGAIKAGGLQAAVMMLKDNHKGCIEKACICLANMANNHLTQNQIVLHGGLSALANILARRDDSFLVNSALICVVNLALNEANHEPILKQGIYLSLMNLWKQSSDRTRELIAFVISNLLSNTKNLDYIGDLDGIPPLLYLAKFGADHSKCLSIAAIRKMTMTVSNRVRLMKIDVLMTLQTVNSNSNDAEIQRDISAILCNLSRDSNNQKEIISSCLQTIIHLMKSCNIFTIINTLGILGNLSEDLECHHNIGIIQVLDRLIVLISHERNDIRREASRVITNIFCHFDYHQPIISNENYLKSIVSLCCDSDQDCQYNALLACRKLVLYPTTHKIILEEGMAMFFSLLSSENTYIIRQVVAIIRDLSSEKRNKTTIISAGGIEEMRGLLEKENQYCIKETAVAILRHLSTENDSVKRRMVENGTLSILISCIKSTTTPKSIQQIVGLFANLSESIQNHIDMIDAGVITVISSLILIQNDEVIQDAARTISNLSVNQERKLLIYQQGAIDILLRLIGSNNEICRRYVALGIQIFCTDTVICRCLLKDWNSCMKILELSKSTYLDYQRTATILVASISNEDIGRIHLTRDGHLTLVLELCSHCDIYIQRDAVCTLANISASPDTHQSLINNGAVDLICNISKFTSDSFVIQELTRFLSLISINEEATRLLLNKGVLLQLMKYARRSDVSTQRFSILTICNFSLIRSEKRNMLQQSSLVSTLMYLTRCPDLEVERCTVLSIAALALGADDKLKTDMIKLGVLKSLSRVLKFPDIEIKQCAALALSIMVLGQSDATKYELTDEKQDFDSLLSLLDTSDEECMHHCVHIIGSLMESTSVRDERMKMDCIESVTKVTISNSIEIKRACGYVFSILAEYKDNHETIRAAGGLKAIVNLASLVDLECQLYGAFSLVFLAGNCDFQVPLVQLGAVRPLVAMMATETEPRHYAGLALLKLAENFENHITIAEEGGIQALLKLGRNRVADEEMKYKASLTVGSLASRAASTLEPMHPMKSKTIGSISRKNLKGKKEV